MFRAARDRLNIRAGMLKAPQHNSINLPTTSTVTLSVPCPCGAGLAACQQASASLKLALGSRLGPSPALPDPVLPHLDSRRPQAASRDLAWQWEHRMDDASQASLWLASKAAGEKYIAKLRQVLLPEAVARLRRLFDLSRPSPFSVRVDTKCETARETARAKNRALNNLDRGSSRPRKSETADLSDARELWGEQLCSSWAPNSAPDEDDPEERRLRSACPGLVKTDGMPKGSISLPTYCTKFGSEAVIPDLLHHSPWGRINVPGNSTPCFTLVEAHLVCKGHWHRSGQAARFQEECSQLLKGDSVGAWTGGHRMGFVFSTDYGPFGSRDPMQAYAKFDKRSASAFAKSPFLVSNGHLHSKSFNRNRDVVVPTSNFMIPSTSGRVLAALQQAAPLTVRNQLAYMVVGTHTRSHLRTDVAVRFENFTDSGVDDRPRAPLPHVMAQYLSSKFCLMADGFAPWSPRLVEFLAAGCVPVVVSSALIPPFHRSLDWSKFSVRIDPSKLPDLRLRLQQLVENGEYDSLKSHVLTAVEAMKYFPRNGALGAGPLVVSELMTVLGDG